MSANPYAPPRAPLGRGPAEPEAPAGPSGRLYAALALALLVGQLVLQLLQADDLLRRAPGLSSYQRWLAMTLLLLAAYLALRLPRALAVPGPLLPGLAQGMAASLLLTALCTGLGLGGVTLSAALTACVAILLGAALWRAAPLWRALGLLLVLGGLAQLASLQMPGEALQWLALAGRWLAAVLLAVALYRTGQAV